MILENVSFAVHETIQFWKEKHIVKFELENEK